MRFTARVSVTLMVATAIALTGCSAGAQDGTVTIRFLQPPVENEEQRAAFEADLDQFEAENPDIRIELDEVPYEQIRNILQTQLRSGDGPDVFKYETGPQAQSLAESGMLLDLSPFYDEYGWDIYDWARDAVTFEGVTYGIPSEVEMLGMFYNRDLLREMRLDDPESFADLPEWKAAADGAGVSVMALGNLEGWPGGQMVSMSISSNNGAAFTEDLVAGERPWTSPEVVAAIQQVGVDYVANGYYASDPSSIDYDRAAGIFYAGDSLMLPTGTWLVGEIQTSTDFEVGFSPFPGVDGEGTMTAGLGSGTYASASTQHPEEVGRFLDYLHSEQHGVWQVENLAQLPAYPVDLTGSDVGELFTTVVERMADLSSGLADFAPSLDVSTSDAFVQTLWPGFQEVMTRQTSPEEFAARLQTAFDEG